MLMGRPAVQEVPLQGPVDISKESPGTINPTNNVAELKHDRPLLDGTQIIGVVAEDKDTSPTCFDSMFCVTPPPRPLSLRHRSPYKPEDKTGEGTSVRSCVIIFSIP
jgi:hypothetical protein